MINHIKFEELLGKHVSKFEDSIGIDFENTLFQKSFYYISDEFTKKHFYGMEYNMVDIITNEDQKVQSISVLFRKVIDSQFYNAFIVNYGEPDHIQVVLNKKEIKEDYPKENNNDFTRNAKKYEIELKEGSFNEKPLYIIWKKDNYEIKAFLRHKQNMSEITFSIK
ncbi:hypothetical protein [uncultured Algibacter sp.]|uniref:hypothetical protein n=1 Tax=uncultured Algibacter sp. TaxID=298659 RepID=UPI0032175F01